jgi:hypothetical protein
MLDIHLNPCSTLQQNWDRVLKTWPSSSLISDFTGML